MRLFRKPHGRHGQEDQGERRFMRGPHHEHGGRFGRGERHGLGERHGPAGRGDRLARFLEHGDLKMLVLHLISEKPRHGYEIIKAIEDLAGGAYAPSPGVVYPTLTLLEELGQVTAVAEGSRKSYAITAAGTEALAAEQDTLKTILLRIAAAKPREAAAPVIRAMENIKTALRLKLGRETTPEQNRKIADVLDAAARQIEDI